MPAGIYMIVNTETGGRYIGSAACLQNRKSGHFSALRKGKHGNPKLQNSFNKYGESCFEFLVLEECPDAELITREQHYIDTLEPEFNICRVAGNCLGVVRSEEAKEKMRKAKIGFRHTEDTKRKIGAASLGRKRSPESIAKFKDALRSRPVEETEKLKARLSEKAKNRSKEAVANIARGRWKAVRQLTMEGELIREWPSAKMASQELGIAPILISLCCRGRQKATKGFRWEFVAKT